MADTAFLPLAPVDPIGHDDPLAIDPACDRRGAAGFAFAILLSIVLVEQDRMTVQRGATDQARALPDVDGYEVARRIRSQSSRPIALIALTGYGEPADQRRALAAGFDLHLVKPITVERLEQAIATFGASPATLIAAG